MKTLILSNGGLKTLFLTELAKREDGEAPLLVYYETESKLISKGHYNAVVAIGEYYHCDTMSLSAPDILHNVSTFYDAFHILLHTLPLARQYECWRILFGWSNDNWRECMHLYEKKIIASFISNIRQTLLLLQTTYLDENPMQYAPPVELEIPLYRLSDAKVIFLGHEYNIPWELAHSCWTRDTLHCGMCDGCHLRQLAFKEAHRPDPTKYLIEHKPTEGKDNVNANNDTSN